MLLPLLASLALSLPTLQTTTPKPAPAPAPAAPAAAHPTPAPPPPTTPPPAPPTTLPRAEKAAGWNLLSDGTTTTNWRGYKQPAFPAKGWEVKDGALTSIAKGGGGDIVTTDQYGDFELSLEFRT